MMRVTFNTPNMSMAQSNPSALRFGEKDKPATPPTTPPKGTERPSGGGSGTRRG